MSSELRLAIEAAIQRVCGWVGLGRDDRLTIEIQEYKGSTALSVQNDRYPDLYHIFYVQKWEQSGADEVIERLEGNEYQLVDGDSP